MLAQGAPAPAFRLAAVGAGARLTLSDGAGRRLALIFLPADLSAGLTASLARYAASRPQFADQSADIWAIIPAPVEALHRLAAEHGLDFPLLSDPDRATAAAYDALAADGHVHPTLYIVDENGAIGAAFEPARYPDLPAPPAVLRSLRRLSDAPRPAPPTGDDWRLGPPDAAVTLIEYSDYQCPHCRTLHGLLKAIEARYGDRIAVIHRHLPLRHTHPLAQLAAEAAEVAGLQGRFWEMHDRLFAAGDALTRADLIGYAAELGLDAARFAADLDQRVGEPAVNEDFKRAVAGGIKLPPTLFINGVLFEGARTEPALCERIEALLKA